MVIDDLDSANQALENISYYRLQAYWYPFKDEDDPHKFIPKINFKRVINLYEFDTKLRLHVLSAIEMIEVSFRRQWSYHFANNFGSHTYTTYSKGLYKSESRLQAHLNYLKESLDVSDSNFVQHFKENYTDVYPPIWASSEIMTFGLLSRFFENIKSFSLRKKICSIYGFQNDIMDGIMEHLTYVRNVCAHHSRLWNKKLKKRIAIPKNKPAGLSESMLEKPNEFQQDKIYNTLIVIIHFLSKIKPNSEWQKELISIIDKYKIEVNQMGFPDNWKELPIWS